MPGIGDLFGRNGVLEQLLLWGVVAQVIGALGSPAFTQLQQNVNQKFPETVLSPEIMAAAVARHLVSEASARTDAAKSGIDQHRFNLLVDIARVRISPAELAEAVLRSYMTLAEAQAQARPQGIEPAELKILADLAGDAPGADQLAQALRRGIIHAHGRGPDNTSFDQGIAETRLHNKWGPVLEKLAEAILAPPEAASAVVRGFLSHGAGEHAAKLSGVTGADFETMVHLAGDAPSPGQLAEALRRGLIPNHGAGADAVSFVQGIREGRLANKYTDMIRGLAKIWPTPIDALDALLKGQLDRHDALALYEKLGGDPQFFQVLFNTRGSSPTPLELISMANRGFIPWRGRGPDVVSYEQGFREGPWKDKWQGVYQKFAEYLPPESTITTLLAHDAITPHKAHELWRQHGMSDETAAAFADYAHTISLSDYRGATTSIVLESYRAGILSEHDATAILEALHVAPAAVKLLLTYTRLQRAFAAVNNAIARTRALFAARKITVGTVKSSLARLGVPAANIEGIVAAWEVENSISVKTLSEAQITSAWKLQLLTDEQAMTELENIGYTPFDAYVLLSLRAGAALPNPPPGGPAPPQAQVVPGTT
jgi:hypothetical protein